MNAAVEQIDVSAPEPEALASAQRGEPAEQDQCPVAGGDGFGELQDKRSRDQWSLGRVLLAAPADDTRVDADQVVCHRGVRARECLSTSLLSRRGVAKATLYWHFRSKDALVTRNGARGELGISPPAGRVVMTLDGTAVPTRAAGCR